MANEEHAFRRLTNSVETAAGVSERLEALMVRLERAIENLSVLSRVSAIDGGSAASASKKGAPPRLRYDKKEAAEMLGVCKRTVDLMINMGYIPATRTGAKVFVLKADLERVAKMDLPSLWPEDKKARERQ